MNVCSYTSSSLHKNTCIGVVKFNLLSRGRSFNSSDAMGQDWKADNLISQTDANDCLCNSIFFHLASSSQAFIHQPQVFTYCLHITVPERAFHHPNKKALIARMAAE